jgi:A/G-specific adenine glycosylase
VKGEEKRVGQFDSRMIQRLLHTWWTTNGRDFEWRRTREPYHLLIAEIMLHRTMAEQVRPIYKSFIARYPTLPALAMADLNDVRKFFAPLGLKWRTKMFVRLIHTLHSRFGDTVPTDAKILKELPGISDYIAAAVPCFSTDTAQVLVDTRMEAG